MKMFWLKRDEDVSGTSGCGVVAEGVIFENGQAAMHWLSNLQSVAIYPNIKTLIAIHGHENRTKVVYELPRSRNKKGNKIRRRSRN